jgi:hypothetical protein
MKPAVARFYLDADVLGLAKLICQEPSDCTYPGDPGAVIRKRRREACPVTSPAALAGRWSEPSGPSNGRMKW